MSFEVIANSSRYFMTYEAAVSQPLAKLEFFQSYSGDNVVVTNSQYKSSLISRDKNYCTDSPLQLKESLRNIEGWLPKMASHHDFLPSRHWMWTG